MRGTRFAVSGLALSSLLLAGCFGRTVQYGGYPYGQPQYVTAPGGVPGPIASPPVLSPTPISSPSPTPNIPPTASPIDESGLKLTPASRTSAWYTPQVPIWRNPSTFAPNTLPPAATHYGAVPRVLNGQQASWMGGVSASRPLNTAILAGSAADQPYRRVGHISHSAAAGNQELKPRGGKTIPDLTYVNIYMGGRQAWADGDRKNIDWALNAAMTDPYLNHVLMQYFDDQPISASYRGSFILDGFSPARMSQANIREVIRILHSRGSFEHLPLESTAICFYLPKGMILDDPDAGTSLSPASDSSSLQGLGGYHGSVRVGQQTVYYAVGAYAERLSNGQTNGIPVFHVPWKDITASFYHQLQEIRTDPDVDAAIATGQERHAGWVTDTGLEIGDVPLSGGPLDEVFVEVPLANGSGIVPVQLCYSNAAQGPEGPIRTPHRGSPLPIPAVNPPPDTMPSMPSTPPSQPSTPPPNAGDADPYFDLLVRQWTVLPDTVKQRILQLVQEASSSGTDERGFGQ